MKAPRCIYCGRFIGLSEFVNLDAKIKFVFDTAFSYERSEYYHERCIDR